MNIQLRERLLWACFASLLSPEPVRAEAAPHGGAQTSRLSGLSTEELAQLTPYAARGPVALIEFADTDAGALPGVNVLVQVQAPVAQLLRAIKDPLAYPRFMGTLDRVEVVSRRASTLVYDWAWDLSIFRLSGRNVMRVYEAPKGSGRGGHRITIDNQSGDFGTGRISIRLLPEDSTRSLMVISLRLDLRHANYVARRAARAGRSVNRSANMALAYAMAFGFADEAERLAGASGLAPTQARNTAPEKPHVHPQALLPLLLRGDVVLLQSRGTRLDQVAVLGRVHQPQPLVREVLLDAQGFGAALLPGSTAEVVARHGDLTTFDWAIDLPLLGVSGQMTLRGGGPIIAVAATSGALSGGQWRFEATAVSPGVTLVIGWATFDIRKSNMLVRALAGADPYLGHGMTAASQLMLLRALRAQARKLADQRQDKPVPARDPGGSPH